MDKVRVLGRVLVRVGLRVVGVRVLVRVRVLGFGSCGG